MEIPLEIKKKLESEEPGPAVLAALSRLLVEDEYLLRIDANERSISSRFGMYLQNEILNYHVDCEYNRDGVEPKRIGHLGLYPDSEDTDGKTVFPDVIVHRRESKENYLIIEIKKSNSAVDRRIDIQKLRAYKADHRLGYRHALFIEIKVGNNPGISQVQWVHA